LSAAATFNATFAIRLGASNFEVGLLASIPALLAILISIPAGKFLQLHPRRKPWVVGSLAIHRTGFLLVAAVPFLPFIPISKGLIVVTLLILISIPAHFFNVGWIPLLAEVVPVEKRANIFAARNIFANITNSINTFLFGIWLGTVIFPLNFSIMYFFGWAASMISCYYIWKMTIPDSPVPVLSQDQAHNIRNVRYRMITFTHENKPFVQIIINTFLHGFGLWAASPLYVLRYIRELSATDTWIGYLATITSLSTIFGMAIWRWLMPKLGESVSLKITIVLAGIFPIMVGVLSSLSPILIASAINGFIAAGINLSHFNLLLKTTPEKNRPGYTAVYITFMNIGAFIFPLIGVSISELIGLSPVLIGCGILSTIGSSSFIWKPVNPKE